MYVCKYWIASVIYKPEVSVCELCRESRHLVLSSKALIASISLFHAYVLSTHFINIAKHSLMYLWDCFVLGTHNNCIKRHSTWVAYHLLSPPRLPIDKHYYSFFSGKLLLLDLWRSSLYLTVNFSIVDLIDLIENYRGPLVYRLR